MDKQEALAQLKDAIVVESLQENLTSGYIDTKYIQDSMLETLSWYMTIDEFDEWKSKNVKPWDSDESCYNGSCSQCDEPDDEWAHPDDSPADRFDLESQIMACWQVVDDLKLLTRQSDNIDDFRSLAVLYEHKFNELWSTFEGLIINGKL